MTVGEKEWVKISALRVARAGSSVCERESESRRSGITDPNAGHTGG